MSSIDLTQLSLEDKRELEQLLKEMQYTVVGNQLVPPLSEGDAKLVRTHVIDALKMGDFTADIVRFSTEGLVQVCLGLLSPVMKPNRPERPD